MGSKRDMIAIGLMSGTSMDGIDAAMVFTDGESVSRLGPSLTTPYTDEFRAQLRAALQEAASLPTRPNDLSATMRDTQRRLTDLHVNAVREVLQAINMRPEEVDVVGFHGHTVTHRPDRAWTWQIGDGGRLAGRLGIPVVADFRSADVTAGGQGAPLVPIYHRALMRRAHMQGCVAILNIGGVANVTWLDFDASDGTEMLAFDTGPGGALLDDWVQAHTGAAFDEDGALASRGISHRDVLLSMMATPYFDETPPKTLDRNDFTMQMARGLSAADGASTLTDFVVESVVAAQSHFPKPVDAWYVCGGGRHNRTLMRRLSARLAVPIGSVDRLGWRGDAVEAEAFAYLAVRCLKNLPTSFPSTTGCRAPIVGGVRFDPDDC